MSLIAQARFLILLFGLRLADAVLTTLPLLASLPHQFVVCINRSFQTFG